MKNKYTLLFSLFMAGTASTVAAQTPADALLMQKNEICIAFQYQHDTWDRYWEGTLLRDNQNIGTLTRQAAVPMFAYGLGSRLNVFGMLPHISTRPSGGQMAGVSGWQDLGLFAKYKLLDRKVGKGDVQAFFASGFSLPVSNYLSDYLPFSLGLGTLELTFRGIIKYELPIGIYARAGYAYLHRTTTEAERNYYFTDKGHYSAVMDVPGATNAELAFGAWLIKRSVQVEAAGIQQICLTGDDIRRQNMPQPTNKMDFTGVSGRLRYFPSFVKGLSIMGGYTQMLQGRNVGKSTVISGGLTWQFFVK
jgi:hypothetical protein